MYNNKRNLQTPKSVPISTLTLTTNNHNPIPTTTHSFSPNPNHLDTTKSLYPTFGQLYPTSNLCDTTTFLSQYLELEAHFWTDH